MPYRAERRDGGGPGRLGGFGFAAKLGLVPAAVLAAPGAHEAPDQNGHPTDEPQTEGENREDEMQEVVDLSPNEELLMRAPWALST
jgi:hypothetical protein